METDDRNLLREYAERHSQDAFTTLVGRHVNLVYSAALRIVQSRPLAEEVAQSVFTDLSRNAGKLKPDTILTAWLYRVAYRTAVDVVRRESRRQHREQQAVEIAAMSSSDWNQIEPLLDEAMENLDETDRAAVLLRYFENKSLREVGEQFGVSDDTAQKRVSRAVERLREFFAKHGVAIGAGALTVVVAGNAVQAAPVGLAVAIATGTIAPLASTAVTKVIAMTTLQKTVVSLVVVAAAATAIYEARQASVLRTEIESLQQQPNALATQSQQLQRERDDALRKLGVAQEQIERSSLDSGEVAALQNEVARLSNELAQVRAAEAGKELNPTASAAQTWLSNVERLKQALERAPQNKIPEFQFLNEQDWLDAAKGDLESEKDFRWAFVGLRSMAQNKFAQRLRDAVDKYMKANNEQFPTAMSQLQSFFQSPVDPSVLERYEILPAEELPNLVLGGDWIISQKAAIDEEYDSRIGIGPRGYGNTSFRQSPFVMLVPVRLAFLKANNGQQPTDPSQLVPYVKTPSQRAALQKVQAAVEAFKQANNGQMPKELSELSPYLDSQSSQ